MDERASVRKPGIPIATRTLTWRDGERDVPVEIRIYQPEKNTEGSWSCRYEVDWPEQPTSTDIFGADSMQALVHALQLIGAEIYTSNYHKSGRLFVEQPGSGYGFPVMSGLRDLLVGDDKKYL
jgi:hypothetical protein